MCNLTQNTRFERNSCFVHPIQQIFMPVTKLIADSGATKAEWCLLINGKKKTIITQGISPYFLNTEQITALLLKELKPKLKNVK